MIKQKINEINLNKIVKNFQLHSFYTVSTYSNIIAKMK